MSKAGGTFSEALMLDAGWDDHDRLTRLAHLRKAPGKRKRAAYVSVMVHVHGWNREQVMGLCGKAWPVAAAVCHEFMGAEVMNNPLQLPGYFLGFHGFRALWEAENRRLGNNFNTRGFVDSVLRAGPVPIDALASLIAPGTR